MKLCAIYNVWDDFDLLEHSIKNIRPLVDGIIVIFSVKSNFGENKSGPDGSAHKFGETDTPIFFFQLEPDPKKDARTNETAKRNFGLDKARELGYTHFLCMDADEFYDPQEFIKEIPRFYNNPDLNGLVCRVKCYFKSPTLTTGYDTTLVPFIHKLEGARHEFNRNYPFAWTAEDGKPFTVKKRIRIDPTRSLNFTQGIEWCDVTMHHLSHVRKDMRKKIRNSTARVNIERSSLLDDYRNAKEGYFCKFYGKTLKKCENVFGLPEIIDSTI